MAKRRQTGTRRKTRAATSGAKRAATAATKRPAVPTRARSSRAEARPKAPRGSNALPASTSGVRLPRDPKGRRAQFYQDPAIDQLWAVVAALASEVSVAFDRLDTFERVLERHGYVTRAAIEAYRPDETAAAERSRRREELIQRVFQVLSQYSR